MSDTKEHVPTVMPTGNRPRNLGKTINDDTARLDAVAKVTGRACCNPVQNGMIVSR